MRTIAILLVVACAAGCTDDNETGMSSGFDADAYVEKANSHLLALTEGHNAAWGIGSAERWEANQETGVISWKFNDGRVVEAPFQIVGTYNTKDGTFLWGWDHPSVKEPLSKDARRVLEFAKEHGIEFLQEREIECTEDAAWELTALATLICDRQGAYRGPAGTARVFMTFGEVMVTSKSLQHGASGAKERR